MSDLLTVPEVAVTLQVDEATARSLAKEGKLAAIALPNKSEQNTYRFRRETIEQIRDSFLDREKP